MRWLGLVLTLVLGCGDDGATPDDGGGSDAAREDAARLDGGGNDAAGADAARVDAGEVICGELGFVGPEDGPVAEGDSGPGRLSEPDAIVAALIRLSSARNVG